MWFHHRARTPRHFVSPMTLTVIGPSWIVLRNEVKVSFFLEIIWSMYKHNVVIVNKRLAGKWFYVVKSTINQPYLVLKTTYVLACDFLKSLTLHDNTNSFRFRFMGLRRQRAYLTINGRLYLPSQMNHIETRLTHPPFLRTLTHPYPKMSTKVLLIRLVPKFIDVLLRILYCPLLIKVFVFNHVFVSFTTNNNIVFHGVRSLDL